MKIPIKDKCIDLRIDLYVVYYK